MNKAILLVFVLVLISSVTAIRECGDINYLNQECRIITPADTSCTTIDILLDDGTVDVDDGVTTQFGSTGMYYYDYTPTNEVGHCVICSDNTSACFNVINYNLATQDNTSLLETESDAALRVQGISKGLNDNRTALQDYGDLTGEWGEVAEITDVSNFSIDELTKEINKTLSETHGTGSWETYTEDKSNIIYSAILLMALALFILSKMSETREFAIFAGIIVVAMTIYSGQYGFYGLDNKFLETVFLIIMWGIGVYLIVKNALDMVKDGGL